MTQLSLTLNRKLAATTNHGKHLALEIYDANVDIRSHPQTKANLRSCGLAPNDRKEDTWSGAEKAESTDVESSNRSDEAYSNHSSKGSLIIGITPLQNPSVQAAKAHYQKTNTPGVNLVKKSGPSELRSEKILKIILDRISGTYRFDKKYKIIISSKKDWNPKKILNRWSQLPQKQHRKGC